MEHFLKIAFSEMVSNQFSMVNIQFDG